MTMAESVTGGAPRSRTPVHLWIVGVLGLLWNAMGCFDYLATELRWEAYMGQFSEEQLAYFYGFPAWVVACWAVAVWGGLAGSAGLLLRRRWAVWAFGLSIAGMVATTIYNFGMSDGAAIMGREAVYFSVLIWVIALVLFLYARAMAKKGVLV
jgi:hypothetical protein